MMWAHSCLVPSLQSARVFSFYIFFVALVTLCSRLSCAQPLRRDRTDRLNQGRALRADLNRDDLIEILERQWTQSGLRSTGSGRRTRIPAAS